MTDLRTHHPSTAAGLHTTGSRRTALVVLVAVTLLLGLAAAPVAHASKWAGPSTGFEGSQDLAAWTLWTQGAGPIQTSSAAALEGGAGLEVGLASDGLALASRDIVPSTDPYLGGEGTSVSFLWSPGTATVPENKALGIVGLRSPDLKLLGWVRVWRVGADWQISAVLIPDDGTPVATPWATLRGVPARVRFEWWARESVWGGGGLRLWVGNEVVGELSGFANRDRGWPSELLVGLVTKGPDGTSGAFHFDAVTAFAREWVGALPPGTHGCTRTYGYSFDNPAQLANWSTWWQNAGSVEVTTQAALLGTYGLATEMDGGMALAAHPLFAPNADGSQPAAEEVQLEFHFSPGSASLPEGTGITIAALRIADDTLVAWVRARPVPGAWEAQLVVSKADGTLHLSPWVGIPSWVTAVRLEWWARPLAAGGGGAQLWLNNNLSTGVQGLDNMHRLPVKVHLGAIGSGTATGQGALRFDRAILCPVPASAP